MPLVFASNDAFKRSSKLYQDSMNQVDLEALQQCVPSDRFIFCEAVKVDMAILQIRDPVTHTLLLNKACFEVFGDALDAQTNQIRSTSHVTKEKLVMSLFC